MQLRLTNEDKTLQAEPKGASVDEGSQGKGKQAASQLRRTSSFYPGYHGLASMSELRTDAPMDLTADEPQSENEDDWIDDSVADRTQGQHAGPSAATANERPTWQGSGTTSTSVTGTTSSTWICIFRIHISVTYISASVTHIGVTHISRVHISVTLIAIIHWNSHAN
ncbi:hypothetical protein EDB87DRAFT_1680740 [Lactarius vividus]|nr:hypothetical protein EDB87DRAFT_1680740 [Lactarius vividus]